MKAMRWWSSGGLILLGLVCLTSIVDGQAGDYYQEAFKRALITFALARTLNGVVSVVQGTEIAVQPAGVGVTLTPGELVDPVNDLIERFSWVMLAASTSLGMQKVMLDISGWWGLRLLTVGMLAIALMLLWRPQAFPDSMRVLLRRVIVMLLFLRLAVPLMLVLNTYVYQVFMDPEVIRATAAIEETSAEIEALHEEETAAAAEADSSFVDAMRGMWDKTTAAVDVPGKVTRYRDRISTAIEDLINLLAIFMLQSIVLPLLFLWVFVIVVRSLGWRR